MNFHRAFACGLIGGLVTLLALVVGRLMGVTALNMELLLGSLFTHDLSFLSAAIGTVLYLLLAGLLAYLYALGFVYVRERASWTIGLLFSLVHVVMTGLAMDALGDLHPLLIRPPLPLLDGHLRAPGLFATNYGVLTVAGLVALHFLYGGLVGALYQRVPLRRLVPTMA